MDKTLSLYISISNLGKGLNVDRLVIHLRAWGTWIYFYFYASMCLWASNICCCAKDQLILNASAEYPDLRNCVNRMTLRKYKECQAATKIDESFSFTQHLVLPSRTVKIISLVIRRWKITKIRTIVFIRLVE